MSFFLEKKSKYLPKHVAFIMDGNRRWAKRHGLSSIEGHKKGSNVVKNIVKTSISLKIKYLTFFSFSTENWNRDNFEVKELLLLLEFYLDTELSSLKKNKINFTVIGDRNKFSLELKKKIKNLETETLGFSNLYLVLALNYGSRNEILNAVKKIKNADIQKLTVNDISTYLMTSRFPDPDFVIRTSGERRLSNFLLWQLAYSELYFTKTLWPDFNSYKYKEALNNFISRNRRFGGN
tara:strand:- start:238 stop:945 length:708 start_codon:yes stop_codon:yes gene_type:complete